MKLGASIPPTKSVRINSTQNNDSNASRNLAAAQLKMMRHVHNDRMVFQVRLT